MSVTASPALITASCAAATNDRPAGNRRNSDVCDKNTRRGGGSLGITHSIPALTDRPPRRARTRWSWVAKCSCFRRPRRRSDEGGIGGRAVAAGSDAAASTTSASSSKPILQRHASPGRCASSDEQPRVWSPDYQRCSLQARAAASPNERLRPCRRLSVESQGTSSWIVVGRLRRCGVTVKNR